MGRLITRELSHQGVISGISSVVLIDQLFILNGTTRSRVKVELISQIVKIGDNRIVHT